MNLSVGEYSSLACFSQEVQLTSADFSFLVHTQITIINICPHSVVYSHHSLAPLVCWLGVTPEPTITLYEHFCSCVRKLVSLRIAPVPVQTVLNSSPR